MFNVISPNGSIVAQANTLPEALDISTFGPYVIQHDNYKMDFSSREEMTAINRLMDECRTAYLEDKRHGLLERRPATNRENFTLRIFQPV